jgi:AcrR family transcriptional regulator
MVSLDKVDTSKFSLTNSPRLSREEARQQTRERLLASAYEVFARRGYAESSVELIAEHAGFSKGAVYSNFSSKQELFLALLRHNMEEDVHWSHELLQTSDDAEEVLRSMGARYQEFEEKLDWCLLSAEFQMEASRRPKIAEEYAQLLRQNRKALGEIMTLLFQKAGKPLPMPADQFATVLMGLVSGLAMQRAADPEAVPKGLVTQAVQEFVTALLRA